MPAPSLARAMSRAAAISVGALFAYCVLFAIFGGEAAWAAGIIFVVGLVPAAVTGAVAGVVVHMLGSRRGAGDGLAPGTDIPGATPAPRWRRPGLWLLGAIAGSVALWYLGIPDRFPRFSMVSAIPAMLVGGAAALRADSLVGRARVAAFSLIALLAATPLIAYAWWAVQTRRPLSPEAQHRWAADSAAYERQLARWVSDSAALDSAALTKDRSALVTLLRTQDSKRAEDAIQAEACERVRLSDLYGFDIMERMVRIADREVWPSERERKEAEKRLYGRVREAFAVQYGGEACESATGSAPKATGTRPPSLGPRPYAPRRPMP